MVESLAGLPAPLVLVIAAVVLAAESGLVVGIVLPGATTALGVGLGLVGPPVLLAWLIIHFGHKTVGVRRAARAGKAT